MAVTRINNNQITDASAGNVYVGIDAGTKLQNYSITATKIANGLVYGSDLTVSGNLTVQGNTTSIDTTITTIEDPLLLLASMQTGSPAVDIGYIGQRGTSENISFAWIEANTEFSTVYTSTTESDSTVTITGYANLHTGNANIAGNIVINGTTSLIGNIIGDANITGDFTGGNILTSGQVSATGDVTGGNILTGGLISATGNITSVANISGGNLLTGGDLSATGNITGGNIISGNAVIGNINVSGDITVNSLTANTYISATGNITGGNINTLGTISTTGNVQANNLLAFSSITSQDVIDGVFISASGNVDAGNVKTGGYVTATGNVIGGNVLTSGYVTATGNVTGGNLVSATVTNPTAMTVSTDAGDLNLTPAGNIVLSNAYINGVAYPAQNQDAASKVYVDNMVSTQLAYHTAVLAATTANLATATGGTITYTQPNGASNGIGAYIQTTGSFTTIDTANVQTVGTRILVKDEGNAVLNGVYTYSNSTAIVRSTDADQYGPNSSEELSVNDYFFVQSGNINEGSAWIVDAPAGTITFGTSNISFAQFSQSQVYEANTQAGLSLSGTTFSAKVDNNTTAFSGGGNIEVKAGANLTTPNIGAATGTSLSVTGTVTAASTVGGVITGSSASVTGAVTAASLVGGIVTGSSVSVTGNVDGGNINTGGLVSATGNVNGGNLIAASLVGATTISATANIDGGNILTTGLISATSTITSSANVIGGNLTTSGQVSATANITGGNLLTGGLISATSNITGGNVTTTGTAVLGNIVISGDDITDTNGRVNFNTAGDDVDFAVNGDTVANVFYIDAGTGTASFGNSTQTINALVAFNTSTSVLMPVGNTAQRPSTGVTGMLRFNTTNNNLELYDNNEWLAVGVPVFTVIDDEQFNGDGSTVAFTLSSTQTTNSCIVSINGVVQIPILAYAVAGTDPTCVLTFTEAPEPGDIIDVREVTTTTTVTSIANSSGNAVIAVSDTSATVSITGDLSITGNATILGNIATDSIQNGSSAVQIPDANGDIHFDVNGVDQVVNITEFGIAVGNIFNKNANGVGNIGNTSTYFNTVFAKSTSAQYADLAEKYTADADYVPGTVLVFGGTHEVTVNATDADRKVAGVVSTNPSYIMNSGLESEHVATVALTGRVPTMVVGPVQKGDLMVSAGLGRARSEADPKVGTVIGKALEDFDGAEGTIEVVVGRF